MEGVKHKREEDKRPVIINERTLLPISFVLVLVGGVYWLTMLHFQISATAKAVEVIVAKQDEYNKTVKEISERLARIEGKLGVEKNDRHSR